MNSSVRCLVEKHNLVVVPSEKYEKFPFKVLIEEQKNQIEPSDCDAKWQKQPGGNPLLITGKVSNCCVLDFDYRFDKGTNSFTGRSAKDYLDEFETRFPFLKHCPLDKTVNKGFHIYLPYFQWHKGRSDYEFGELLTNTTYCTLFGSQYLRKDMENTIGKNKNLRSFDEFPLDKIKVHPEFIDWLKANEKNPTTSSSFKRKFGNLSIQDSPPAKKQKLNGPFQWDSDFLMDFLPKGLANSDYNEWIKYARPLPF